MHDPLLADFKSGDPKFTDYPSLNHYAHCGANFANAVDPFGQDIFLFDKRGNLIHIYETEEDEIQIADKNGNAIPGIYLSFDEKVMTVNKDIQKDGMSFFSITNDKSGKEIFEFLATYTEVEWSLIQLTKNKKEINSLSSSHDEDMEKSNNEIISNYFGKAHLRTFYHNHPNGIPKPSGYSTDHRYGDIEHFKMMDGKFNTMADYYIFTKQYDKSIYTKINPYEIQFKPSISDIIYYSNSIFGLYEK